MFGIVPILNNIAHDLESCVTTCQSEPFNWWNKERICRTILIGNRF